MLKKIFCAAILCAAVYCTAVFLLINAASAQDVWVDSENGTDYYVMDETFVNETKYRDNRQFTVNVKFVRNQKAEMKKFSFRENDGMIFCSIDGGEKGFVYKGTATYAVWEFGLKFLGIDYEVRYD